MSAEKSSKKGFAILFVGVMIGIGVGIAACVTTMVHPPSATASAKTEALTVKAPAQPLPSLYPPPAQTASLTPSYESAAQPQQEAAPVYQQVAAPVYQQVPTAPTGLAIQSQDGTLLMPGVNAYETRTQQVANVTTYDTTPLTIGAGNVNPNWTVGRNGLMQNPCVDPPSAHGRATGPY